MHSRRCKAEGSGIRCRKVAGKDRCHQYKREYRSAKAHVPKTRPRISLFRRRHAIYNNGWISSQPYPTSEIIFPPISTIFSPSKFPPNTS